MDLLGKYEIAYVLVSFSVYHYEGKEARQHPGRDCAGGDSSSTVYSKGKEDKAGSHVSKKSV